MTDDVRERLRAGYRAHNDLDNLYDKYMRKRAGVERITPKYSLAPGGSGQSDREHQLAELADLEHQYNADRRSLNGILGEVQALVDTLTDYRMRQVLTCRYVEFMRWEEIACRCHYSYQHVLKLHHDAVAALIAAHQKQQT